MEMGKSTWVDSPDQIDSSRYTSPSRLDAFQFSTISGCRLWSSQLGSLFRFYRTTHASTVYAVVVCLSVTSRRRCSTETAKSRMTQTMPPDSPRTGTEDLGITQTGHPNGGAICRWGRSTQTWRLSTTNLPVTWKCRLSQALSTWFGSKYHTERPLLFAACLPWCSASCGFVGDSWYLLFSQFGTHFLSSEQN